LKNNKLITVGITGASGVVYGLRLLEVLALHDSKVYLIVSKAARIVFEAEENIKLPSCAAETAALLSERIHAAKRSIKVFDIDDWFAPVASGSGAPRHMVICPCTTGTLSAIAAGASDNLLERAADVVLKEQGKLILVPREMPFSTIHLENMLRLSKMGATIIPASPCFYNRPQTIADLVDTVVGRVLDHLGIQHSLFAGWGRESAE